jgi:hypothetical protein
VLAAPTRLGGYFLRMASEEADSVSAFVQLEANLAVLGAPRELRAASLRSARDEVRHAATMAGLARRNGGAPTTRAPRRAGLRDLGKLARENAAQGCIRETFAALLAWRQASRAAEPELRQVFRRIARDETRHAALAWAIARWAERSLAPAARRGVARARTRALRALRRELRPAPHPELVSRLGLPSREDAAVLLSAFEQALHAHLTS